MVATLAYPGTNTNLTDDVQSKYPFAPCKNLGIRLNITLWLKISSSKKTYESKEMSSVLIRSLKVTVNIFVLFILLFDLQCDQSQDLGNVSRKVTYFQDPK